MGEGKTIENPKIYAAIAGVIADVGSVAKDKVNKQQGFKYRSVDDVFNALHPALAKNKVFIVPRILKQNREIVGTTKNGAKMTLVICDIKFTFYAEDGSHVEAVITGEGLDTGDKATNKAMAIAYKYACFQVFCIPTEDMIDPDSERLEMEDGKEVTGNKKSSSRKPAAKKSTGHTKSAADGGGANETDPETLTQPMLNTIRGEIKRTGVTEKQITDAYKVKTLEDMPVILFDKVMKRLKITPDKQEEKHE